MSLVSLPVRNGFPACAFAVPMYPVHVAVIPCLPNQKRAERIHDLLPAIPLEQLMEYNTPAHASVITFEFDSDLPWLMIVTFEPESTVSTIAHETFHLTHRVMQYIHADFSHEPYAYLYENLFSTLTLITTETPDPSTAPGTCATTEGPSDPDAEGITFLNTEHDLGVTPLAMLNQLIAEHITTSNH